MCSAGLSRESGDRRFEEVTGEGRNFQMKVDLEWAVSIQPSYKL